MQQERMRVCFNDEAPRIGSGWRIVTAQVGRKFVRVADQHGNRAKFTRAQWEKITPTTIALPPKRKRRRRKAVH